MADWKDNLRDSLGIEREDDGSGLLSLDEIDECGDECINIVGDHDVDDYVMEFVVEITQTSGEGSSKRKLDTSKWTHECEDVNICESLHWEWGDNVECSKDKLIADDKVVMSACSYEVQKSDIIDSYIWALSAMGVC
jgi:hypothetical protein